MRYVIIALAIVIGLALGSSIANGQTITEPMPGDIVETWIHCHSVEDITRAANDFTNDTYEVTTENSDCHGQDINLGVLEVLFKSTVKETGEPFYALKVDDVNGTVIYALWFPLHNAIQRAAPGA